MYFNAQKYSKILKRNPGKVVHSVFSLKECIFGEFRTKIELNIVKRQPDFGNRKNYIKLPYKKSIDFI